MTFASGLQRQIAIVAESTYGTTPATPAFTYARVLEGATINGVKQAEIIRQLSQHVNAIDYVQLGQDAAGSYNLVPTYGGAFETLLLQAIRQSAFSTNTAWNGRVESSFTVEEQVTGTAANYLRYTGAQVESLNLSMVARGLVEASVNLQGQDFAYATSTIAGATYAAVGTGEFYNALGVSGIAIQGLSPVPSVRSLKCSIKHALQPVNVVGNINRVGHISDMIEVSGTVETYFEDNSALSLFLNHSSGSLVFIMGTVTLNKYRVTFPKVFFSKGEVSQAGAGPIMATFDFAGVYDGTNGAVKIDKAVA